METDKNIAHFYQLKEEGLLKDLKGQWIVIREGRFLSAADTREEAREKAYATLSQYGVTRETNSAPLLIVEADGPQKIDIPTPFIVENVR